MLGVVTAKALGNTCLLLRPYCPHLQLTLFCPQKPGILGDSPLGTLQPGSQSANPLLGELSAGNRPCPLVISGPILLPLHSVGMVNFQLNGLGPVTSPFWVSVSVSRAPTSWGLP